MTLFMAMVATGCCCFCVCRYLVRRHLRLQSPLAGRDGAATRSPGRWGPPRAAEGQLGSSVDTPAATQTRMGVCGGLGRER